MTAFEVRVPIRARRIFKKAGVDDGLRSSSWAGGMLVVALG